MKRATILITGATGFIGKHLVHALQTPSLQRHYNVLCLVRKPISSPFILGSLENKDTLLRATNNVDYVIHLASQTRSSDKNLNYVTNIIGTKNLIGACKENNVKRFIYSGTVNADFRKRGVYGESKKQAEELVKKSGLDYVILKLNMVYGIGDSNLSKTITLAKKLPIVPVVGNGNQKMQPVYVDDVIGTLLRCLKVKTFNTRVYNIAGPRSMTFNEYLHTILTVLHLQRIKIHIPAFFIRWFVMITGKTFEDIITLELVNSITQDKSLDISAARRDLDFKPREFRMMLQSLMSKNGKNLIV